MLTMAYMITTNSSRKKTKIHLKTFIGHEDEREKTVRSLEYLLENARIDIVPEIIVMDPALNRFEKIQEKSKKADLVFIGMKSPEIEKPDEEYVDYYVELLRKTENFPTTAIVLASEDIPFREILETV